MMDLPLFMCPAPLPLTGQWAMRRAVRRAYPATLTAMADTLVRLGAKRTEPRPKP